MFGHTQGYQNEQQRAQEVNKLRLVIRVIEARGIKAGDFSGTSDPYAELRIKNQSQCYKTRTIKKTLSPFWNEEFVLYPTNPSVDVLSIKVYDFDPVTNNDLLGEIEIPVSTLVYRPPMEEWRQLCRRNYDKLQPTLGEVKIYTHFQGSPNVPYPSSTVVYPQGQQVQYPPQTYPQSYPPPNVPPPPYTPHPTPQQSFAPTAPPPQPYPQQPAPNTYPPPHQPMMNTYPPPTPTYPAPTTTYVPPQPSPYPAPVMTYPTQPVMTYPAPMPTTYYPPAPTVYTTSYPSPYPTYQQPPRFIVPTTYVRTTYSYPSVYDPRGQFVCPIGLSPHLQAKMLQASQIFRMFDRDYSGYLNKKEWKRAMRSLGYAFSKHEAKRLFYMVDKDYSGRISEREFCEFWLTVNPY